MTKAPTDRPEWLIRAETMIKYEVITVLRSVASYETIRKRLALTSRRYKVRDRGTYTLIAYQEVPNFSYRPRGTAFKTKEQKAFEEAMRQEHPDYDTPQ